MSIRAPISAVRQDLAIPAGRLAEIIGGWPEPSLLESGPGYGAHGRYSILAAHPRLVWEATGERWSLRTEGVVVEQGDGDILAALGAVLRRYRLAEPGGHLEPGDPPFQGGMIGFFGYDLAPRLERLPRRIPRDSRMPDIRLALYDTAVIVDLATASAGLWAWDLTGEGRSAALTRCDAWRAALERAARSQFATHTGNLGPIKSGFSRASYVTAVGRALDYIRAGDIFQANLSQRFTARGSADPLGLYLRLKTESPAPFAAFLRWDDMAVVSASPELFYQTQAGRVVTRPIKGTRPRDADPALDATLARELRASPKDRAELAMVVDLERNDIGRVCEYGSIRVVEPFTVESFAQVHHLVATVEGTLGRNTGPIELLKAVFPGGSITGAPKIRAMEIIDELERNRRGLYTGSIGYLSQAGSSAFNIAIRTLLIEGDRISFQVGGGIVADSDPEAEYDETLAKGKGLVAVLDSARGERVD